MKSVIAISLAALKHIPRAITAFALLYAPSCEAASASALDAAANDNAITLRGEEMSPEGFFSFFFDANSGEKYPITVSLDLLNWTILTNIVGEGGPLSVQDQDASKFSRRFYHMGALPTPVPNMVFIGPGTFTMGSPDSEDGRDGNEGPQAEVTISRGFWMGKYEVTQLECIAVTGSNYAHLTYNTSLPLDSQSWIRATNYCSMLTVAERAAGRLPAGYCYRLPTEAEWEYACRAGTTTPFAVGDGTSLGSTQANFDGTFPYAGAAPGRFVNATTVGGRFGPNAWGLYDMHGNLWEWCQDWYGPYRRGKATDPKGPETGTSRVLRGGGYTSAGKGCRSAKRDYRSPTYANTIQGFRVVLARDP